MINSKILFIFLSSNSNHSLSSVHNQFWNGMTSFPIALLKMLLSSVTAVINCVMKNLAKKNAMDMPLRLEKNRYARILSIILKENFERTVYFMFFSLSFSAVKLYESCSVFSSF